MLLFVLLLFIYYLYLFIFVYRKIRKVLNGVLARVQARSPGSSPCSNPSFDVLSPQHYQKLAIFCVLRELFFTIRTDCFFLFRLIFRIFRKYPVPSIDNFSSLLSTCNINTYFKQYYDVRTLCKTRTSLYTDLFLNERNKF